MRIVFLGLIVVGSLCAEEFVIKKKKKQSIASLKDDCCQACGRITTILPDVLRDLADIQTIAVTTIQGVFESDKDSFCERASKQDLHECVQTLNTLCAQLEDVHDELSQQIKALTTLHTKKK